MGPLPRLLLFPLLCGFSLAHGAPRPPRSVQGWLERRMQEMQLPPLAGSGARKAVVARETVEYRRDLVEFYARREHRPAWIQFGRPGPAAWQLIDAVNKSYLEGLEPAGYHAP